MLTKDLANHGKKVHECTIQTISHCVRDYLTQLVYCNKKLKKVPCVSSYPTDSIPKEKVLETGNT